MRTSSAAMKYPVAVLAVLCACALTVSAQTKVLEAKSRVPTNVSFDEFRAFALPTLCDDRGRSYVKLAKQGHGMVGPLLRLSSKGMLEAEFDTTGELVNIYAARPNGGVAMLNAEDMGSTKIIDNFSPDSTRESAVKLDQTPIPFFPMQIAVFPGGEILIAGLQYHPGYKASTAIYDGSGHLIKQIVLDGDAEIEHGIDARDPKYAGSAQGRNGDISRSVAITADDGLVYLMRSTAPATVYAISAAGEVVHKIVVSAPSETGQPAFGLRVVKNKLAVKFYETCDGPLDRGCRGTVYRVVDAATGKKLADYEAGSDVVGPIACYIPEPDRFYTFTLDQHRLQIVEAGAK
jgi:hypothetical protein